MLTDKERECTLRESEIERIAGEIGDSRVPLVIIHGAGSFGHPQAKEHRIGEGPTRRGLIETHRAVMKLNNAIIKALNRAGLDAIGVHPLDFIMMRENRVADLDSTVIEKMIEFGLTPVLHGDVVMDSERGASVISGDQILRELGSRLEVSRVGAGTNVDGVLDKRGRTIARITPETFNHLSLRQRDEYSSVDVTGEMRGKVKELIELAENGVESLIFNASRGKMVYNFLRGKDVGGTRITPQ